MKKIIENRIYKKFFMVFMIIIIFFNFLTPTYSFGWDLGGVLLKPITGLLTALIDAVNGIIGVVLGGTDSIIDGNFNALSVLASPERIFAGGYPILNANIFNVDFSTYFPTRSKWSY